VIFDPLARELDLWGARGRRATLWWRDDDACRDSPALGRLLALARTHAVPVAIAAVPATLESSLAHALAGCREATVIQHGFAHRNHAPEGERSSELGAGRDVSVRVDELRGGRGRLAAAFGDRFAPILVPPWNRAGDDLLPHLRGAGFAGLSRFGPRGAREAADGLLQVNAHVDPIAWRRDRQFIGDEAALARWVEHLRARREGTCDADEPTGLLTHHLAFDDAAWTFVDALLAHTGRHPGCEWLDVQQAFARDRASDHLRPISMNRV
jgi:hypothetical protein